VVALLSLLVVKIWFRLQKKPNSMTARNFQFEAMVYGPAEEKKTKGHHFVRRID